MNFIAHYYMDRHVEDSYFFLGVNAPDLVSIHNRRVRLKEHNLPLLMENDASEREINFYNGVLRHLEVDRVFHTSPFFERETEILGQLFRERFSEGTIKRSYFLAHILFELMLDRVMMVDDPSLLSRYYGHWENVSNTEIVHLTEWMAGKHLPGYASFLKKFVRKKYLYHYQEIELFTGVIRRIMERVRITETDFLYTPAFQDLLVTYEQGLRSRYPLSILEFGKKLVRI